MNILFVGAHTDDIEHGAGGLLSSLLQGKKHSVRYLSLSRCTDLARNKKILEDQEAVQEYIESYGGSVRMMHLPNRYLPEFKQEIREVLEEEKKSFCPHIVFTHSRHDIHQDHKAVADECLRVFRNGTILGYECLRSCPQFVPNFFVVLEEKAIRNKIELLSLYKTQKELYYLTSSSTESLAMTRGAMIGEPYAEGFDLVRMVSGGETCVQLL